ncbi:MAG: glycosyltransferase family 4 protein [Leptolyngbyaceae cyanobacterium bins.302]|nr:glycosyltransferase family 4 protein [Leptolyngbyaceae cyanobacterium bins.302]
MANDRRKILVISPIPSHPHNAGNRARVYSLLTALETMGHQVHFAHIQETPGDELTMQMYWGDRYYPIAYTAPLTTRKSFPKRLEQRLWRKFKALLGDDPRYNYQIDDWYDPAISEVLSELGQSLQPDVVMVEYVFFSKALECFPNVSLKLIDTHDIFAGRYQLYLAERKSPQWFSTNRQQEDRGLRRADKIIAIQEKEARLLGQRIGSDRIVTVGHLVPIDPVQRPADTCNLLFLGSMNPINVHTIEYFLREVFPLCKAKIPGIRLILAGEVGQAIDDRDDCLKLGSVDALRTAYAQADIVINPILFGTGLKVKNIEALGFGKPLVTTSVGATGLEDGIGSAFLVADTPKQFAAEIVDLHNSIDRYNQLALQAEQFAQRWNKLCLSSLSQLISEATTTTLHAQQQ